MWGTKRVYYTLLLLMLFPRQVWIKYGSSVCVCVCVLLRTSKRFQGDRVVLCIFFCCDATSLTLRQTLTMSSRGKSCYGRNGGRGGRGGGVLGVLHMWHSSTVAITKQRGKNLALGSGCVGCVSRTQTSTSRYLQGGDVFKLKAGKCSDCYRYPR